MSITRTSRPINGVPHQTFKRYAACVVLDTGVVCVLCVGGGWAWLVRAQASGG
jgi:hypothetical protein